MKIPENREKFIGELRKALEDVVGLYITEYTNLGIRPKGAGSPTESEIEHGHKCIGVAEYGIGKKTEIAFIEDWDALNFYEIKEDGKRELIDWLNFEDYKNKTTYFMAVAAKVARIFN